MPRSYVASLSQAAPEAASTTNKRLPFSFPARTRRQAARRHARPPPWHRPADPLGQQHGLTGRGSHCGMTKLHSQEPFHLFHRPGRGGLGMARGCGTSKSADGGREVGGWPPCPAPARPGRVDQQVSPRGQAMARLWPGPTPPGSLVPHFGSDPWPHDAFVRQSPILFLGTLVTHGAKPGAT